MYVVVVVVAAVVDVADVADVADVDVEIFFGANLSFKFLTFSEKSFSLFCLQ